MYTYIHTYIYIYMYIHIYSYRCAMVKALLLEEYLAGAYLRARTCFLRVRRGKASHWTELQSQGFVKMTGIHPFFFFEGRCTYVLLSNQLCQQGCVYFIVHFLDGTNGTCPMVGLGLVARMLLSLSAAGMSTPQLVNSW